MLGCFTMNEIEYQRFLFDTAMLVMACDGDIHDDEIAEMGLAFQHSAMFKGLDFDAELKRFLAELHQDTRKTIDDYFKKLQSIELDPVQELQVLEIVLRIMYADDRADENEIRFLRLVKERLGVMDEIFYKRFGDVDVLPGGVRHTEKAPPSMNKFVAGFELADDIDMAATKVNK